MASARRQGTRGRPISAPAPLSQPLHLQLERSLEGRRHFLCPPPISMPSPKVRRQQGWEGAWKWGTGGLGSKKAERGGRGLCVGVFPPGASARPTAPTDRRPGLEAVEWRSWSTAPGLWETLRNTEMPGGQEVGDCPVSRALPPDPASRPPQLDWEVAPGQLCAAHGGSPGPLDTRSVTLLQEHLCCVKGPE